MCAGVCAQERDLSLCARGACLERARESRKKLDVCCVERAKKISVEKTSHAGAAEYVCVCVCVCKSSKRVRANTPIKLKAFIFAHADIRYARGSLSLSGYGPG